MIKIYLTFLFSAMALLGSAQLTVNPLYQDHAVLQRDIAVPIKGKADPGTMVYIDMGNSSLRTTTGLDGKWRVLLPAMQAGGPHTIAISTDQERVTLNDIYFGDIWLCSGQSNMEWPVWRSDNADEVLAAIVDQGIRHIGIPHSGGTDQYNDIAGGTWEVDGPESRGDFTAVGYFFARYARHQREVPIGLLHSSWGGSRIEPWMRAEILGYPDNASAAALIKAERAAQSEARLAKLRPIVGDLTEEDQGMKDGKAIWVDPSLDISSWPQISVPGLWEEGPLTDFDGVVWMAYDMYLTVDPTDMAAELHLGKVDDSDHTYVNGTLVGSMINQYAKQRIYDIPSGVLRKGKNRIMVRVEDNGGGGGIYGDPLDLYLKIGGELVRFKGGWSYKASAMFKTGSQNINQQPTLLYNHMIHPLLDFPIKGVLWYQGESNAGAQDALNYEEQLSTMITDWRKLWGVGDFPFLSVQLANFMSPDDNPRDGGWPRVREAIANVSDKLENAGDAVIIDIGAADDIHPTNKRDVGRRLGYLADKIAYGSKREVWNSPRYKSKRIEGSKIILQFDDVGDGLRTNNKFGYVHGFAIAGQDRDWTWAKASITGNDEITVHADDVVKPLEVRYAWGINPDVIDVYGDWNLPLSPFRTDDWGYPVIKYLALGDSYTAGTSVEQASSFPYQLAATMSDDVTSVDVDVIARNGWTTTDLKDSIALTTLDTDYDIVTLLIGVNNQYQGKEFSLYKNEFTELLDKAISYAGGDAKKVAIVSIPDYAYTPYGQTRPDPNSISAELNKYNAYADQMARDRGVSYVYITDITRKGLEDAALVAKDKLHPSGVAYRKMVPRIAKAIKESKF